MNAKTFSRKIALLKTIFGIMGVRSTYIVFQAFSSLVIGFLDGLSIGLIIPLAKGIIEKDFSFLEKTVFLKHVIARFPYRLTDTAYAHLFFLLVIIIFATVLLRNVLDYLFRLYAIYNRGTFLVGIQTFIFNRYLSFGRPFFDRTSQGHVRRMISISEKVTSLVDIFSQAIRAACTLAVYVVMMAVISWKLTLFILLGFPVFYYSAGWLMKRISLMAEMHANASFALSRELFNMLSSIPLIKAYNREEKVRQRFSQINNEMRRLNYRMQKRYSMIDPPQRIISAFFLLALIAVVGFLFMKTGARRAPAYLGFILLARRSMGLFSVLNKTRGKFEKVRPIVRKVLEVLDDNEKFYIPEGPRMFHGLKKSIEFRNATFSYYPDVPVLKEVSFSIEKGKMTAIVGPTGAGKTTIMNLIMRFYDCAPARVFVDGTDIREYTLKSLRDHMALVDQDVIVFNDTIMNNIAFGIDERVSDEKLNSVVKKAQLDDLIGRLPDGFRTEVGDRGIKLSGGEKQRISIGRALLKDSDIVLLDEATSSLDTGTEKRIQKAIEEAIRGRTTVVIAHRLSTIKNADKIIVIEEGRLIEQGTLEELLAKKGRFYQYWEEQKFY